MKVYYGWVVVAAGALMGCVAIGSVFSLAVFLAPMSETTGWSRTGISGAMTIVFVTMGFASFGWGALTDRFGPRIVVLAGGLLLGLGLALASRATCGASVRVRRRIRSASRSLRNVSTSRRARPSPAAARMPPRLASANMTRSARARAVRKRLPPGIR